MKSNFISHLHSRTLYLSIILLSLVSYSFLDAAWTAPTGNPPTGNVAEPINEGSVSQTKLGAFGTGPLLVDGDVQVIDATPSIKYNDNTAGEKAFWSYVNSNIYYILADRDGVTTTWEGNHPLVLYAGYTDSTTDYATFANEVRATSYCNRAGASCFTAAAVTSLITAAAPTTQFYSLSGIGAETSKTVNMGSAWEMCALTNYETTADDDNNFDHCEVRKSGASWILDLTKYGTDSLICGAVCINIP